VRKIPVQILVGASRKSFLDGITASTTEPSERLGASLAAAIFAARAGASILRVHDVGQTRQALAVSRGLEVP
jgi:dihydropteroate synthase